MSSDEKLMPDRIVVGTGAGARELTLAAFRDVPLEQQMEMLMQGKISFFSRGKQLRTLDALKALREAKVSGK